MAGPGHAQNSPTASTPAPTPTTEHSEPTLLNADTVTFDDTAGLVTAEGNVELSQGERILLANSVTFNKKTNVVTATGNVRMLEPSGDVMFADYTELTKDMSEGFVQNLRTLTVDNARVAANEGERTDQGRFLRMSRAVYSPCNLCAEDPTRPPIWQIKAVRVTQDNEEHQIYYHDATVELAGFPVFYTPFLSTPDPTVDRRAGLLPPRFGDNSNIGAYAIFPYYYPISDDKDVTVDVGASTNDGPYLGAQYRQRFESGKIKFDGAMVYAKRETGTTDNSSTRPETVRGYITGTGEFDINDEWRWGFDVNRASDSTFMERYHISGSQLLESDLYLEQFSGRDYFKLSAINFQDLRTGVTQAEPTAAPLAQWNLMGEPNSLLGGRWALDSTLMSLTRTVSDATDTRRVTVQPSWQRIFYSDTGLVTTTAARVLAEGYNADNLVAPYASITKGAATTGRILPQGQVTIKYPVARQYGTVMSSIQPIAQITVSPRLHQPKGMPNEDSTDMEFDESNLFSWSRFPGLDRVESGTWTTYGLQAGFYGSEGGSSSVFLGQSYRLTSDTVYPDGSGLQGNKSDYVGSVRVSPTPLFDVNYSFRFDSKTLAAKRHEVTVVGGPANYRAGINFLDIDQTPSSGVASKREFLTGFGTVGFAKYYQLGLAFQRDLRPDPSTGGARNYSAYVGYTDECLTAQIEFSSTNSTLADASSGTSFQFRIVLKNLGELGAQGLTPDPYSVGVPSRLR